MSKEKEIVASPRMKNYFGMLTTQLNKEYSLATEARQKGYDPEKRVDILIAKDIADRVEKLISAEDEKILNVGLPARIRELNEEYGDGDWRVALVIAKEVSHGKFSDFGSLEKNIEMGVRVGLAYVTMAVTAAPLEGFVNLKLKDRRDKGKYIAVYFAGPIRAAGATAAAVTLIIADYLRVVHKLEKYDVSPEEVERYKVELNEYHSRVARLQYKPANEELEFLLANIPVEINGDSTTDKEVPTHKNLSRVETNKIRGGMCLVLGEGIAAKAKKLTKNIDKWADEFGIGDWKFLHEYLKIQAQVFSKRAVSEDSDNKSKVLPNYKYLEEAVAGRPIFSYPMHKGGFRLRYGRSRLTGLGGQAVHPVTMFVMGSFIATGTQLRVERPGKASVVTPCDSIEPPVVLLKDGEVKKLESVEEYEQHKNQISKILFNGDLLICYGDFLENNQLLAPSGYVEEWWVQDLLKAIGEKGEDKAREIIPGYEKIKDNLIKSIFDFSLTGKQAIELSKSYDIPLYPKYLHFWGDMTLQQAKEFLQKMKNEKEGSQSLSKELKPYLEEIKIPHKLKDDRILLDENFVETFYYSFSKLYSENEDVEKVIQENDYQKSSDIINHFSNVRLKEKAPICIGSRMGRPEKAKLRKMKGKPQVLFSVGEQGGKMRSLQEAYIKGYVEMETPYFWCYSCSKPSESKICSCGLPAEIEYYCLRCKKAIDKNICDCGSKARMFIPRRVNIRPIFDKAMNNLGISKPPLIKGVKGVNNKTRVLEALEKGVLRAIHNLYVNKDGTIRYDAIEVPVTHFKPGEVGTSVQKLKEMGYDIDINGEPLENDNQVLELKPQDLILPGYDGLEDSNSSKEILKIMNFVDDLLEKFYGLPRYYNIQKLEDVVGHLVIGIAPHTSAGTLGRIVGFSKTQGYFAHPFFHSACRRNCDGDELSFIVLLDGLLNFSRQYLPDVRGGRVMDAPLVLTTYLDPNEIDSEAHNMDVAGFYPLNFYEKTEAIAPSGEAQIDIIKKRLGTERQLEGMEYTHPVSSINDGVRLSAYKDLDDMLLKITAEMSLAEKLTSVPTEEVAAAIIEKHFLRDLRGNLRQYATQSFRCVACNTIYRRIPLLGKCISCNGKIILTVSEGTITKYLPHCISLSEKYNLSQYIKEQIEIIQKRVELIFGKEPTKQVSLSGFI